MMGRTIAAISTPPGRGGISVIRVSGEDAVKITASIFSGADLTKVTSHSVHYGYITDNDGNRVDEVLVTVMLAPKTYTREDVTEISTHGGLIASRRVMKSLISAGAYPAEAGEFTKRAFLNGRIDLSQAEGVIDIINAQSIPAQKNALSQAGGGLSWEINSVRNDLVSLSAAMQVAIDYPDEDLEDVTLEDIEKTLDEKLDKVKNLIATSESGRILKEGIKTAIIGKPNVGKSSLLNRIAREERAIVTDIAGTTRDIIEEFVSLNGVPLRLMDTAGIRDTSDTVEQIGVERSKQAAKEAELVILVMDATSPQDGEDCELLKLTENSRRIIVVNKTDLCKSDIPDGVMISAKTGEGIDALADKIRDMYELGKIGEDNCTVITNMRHLSALEECSKALSRALDSVRGGMPQDIAALDIYGAIDKLGEITGDTVSEDIVSEIFHNFCVGK